MSKYTNRLAEEIVGTDERKFTLKEAKDEGLRIYRDNENTNDYDYNRDDQN